MVLRAATKDENVPRPRTSIVVGARDRGRATLASTPADCMTPHFAAHKQKRRTAMGHPPLKSGNELLKFFCHQRELQLGLGE
jgi:hypothetical protein